ncbi:nuclear transport factor 2 family protein [Pseudoalteromonas sp. SR44-5]|nr:nuclear transport factor 2 family protein [Pseudoalteromonas sp. SR41-8]MBB1335021.1 nuclear transport factor 2 family protein [Pseudoalteromonas sp. SR41-6]MBB1342896.1 nuclear transport factor 2 family protein [Pseudoalteromonas sp. SR45-6]MBB1368288.1 nuclear transport factor 2 family protein [Pseudoalteromonas sp. SR44-5]MBB1418688.1 nuclear transport factor 2 family protein [Pseudoalteromonas sp. SG44-1]MBB1423649.1 nuclear transport factor 2 family protein [Pseudoalteromonas sp. SG43-
MKKLYLFALLLMPLVSQADVTDLQSKMMRLDTALFDSFNHCNNPVQLAKHASYFAEGVEFYHDNGGVTWDRNSMIANTKQYACGKYTRELVSGTFEVFTIKDFGVMTKGTHIFCQNGGNKCDGKADFVMLWHDLGDKLEITRVLSYGHRSNMDNK